MRTRGRALVGVLLILGLLIPTGVGAKRPVAVFGRLSLTNDDGAPFDPAAPPLLGFATIANPGGEKAITMQIPPYTFPVVVRTDLDDQGNPGNLNTLVVLTNVSGAVLTVRLTLLDAGGTPVPLTTPLLVLSLDQTVAVSLASLLAS
jgi:hypothetical protein